MNINLIKETLAKNLNRKVIITVHGMRNKTSRYEGRLYKLYPNLFSIIEDGIEKTFSYNDYIIGDVKIKYL